MDNQKKRDPATRGLDRDGNPVKRTLISKGIKIRMSKPPALKRRRKKSRRR